MSWQMLGRPIYTADNSASSPGVYQAFILPENCSLKAVRIGVIQFNNPTYTGISLNIFANRSSAPGKLLYTSTNTVLKATIDESISHAYAEIYFEFSSEPSFVGTEGYFAAPFITGGYVGNSSTHLAWKNGWPDPIYDIGLTVNQAKAAKFPLDMHFITSEI